MTNLYGMNDYYRSGPHEPDTRDDYDSLRDEPECCNPNSATSEANREQTQRASNVAWRARLEATRAQQ
jgi:hypothetical protein